jgi:hypothetical protein
MPRPRERVCLEDGLKLDLNWLARSGFIQRSRSIGSRAIRWTHWHWGEIATGIVSADMSGRKEGWLRVQIGNWSQTIVLIARPRHFGGSQWYFMCPTMNRPASVLWKPNGASAFRSRGAWGNMVAYQSQFNGATNRAHAGKARIRSRLIANPDPDEWDLPPRPKWMRRKTYDRHVEHFNRYEAELDRGCALAAAKLGRLKLI